MFENFKVKDALCVLGGWTVGAASLVLLIPLLPFAALYAKYGDNEVHYPKQK
jgi:hypothetical protein